MAQRKNERDLNTLVLYWSVTGNTKQVADVIYKTLVHEGIAPVIKNITEAADEDLYNYDLVFFGVPSYAFLPPDPVLKYVKIKMNFHRKRGDIKPCAPQLPGKSAVIFCTYSGPHTGIDEATPVGNYLGQFFEHIGFKVEDKWYSIGEYHGDEILSTKGKLGDIRGRPNAEDLSEIENNVSNLLKTLTSRKQ